MNCAVEQRPLVFATYGWGASEPEGNPELLGRAGVCIARMLLRMAIRCELLRMRPEAGGPVWAAVRIAAGWGLTVLVGCAGVFGRMIRREKESS